MDATHHRRLRGMRIAPGPLWAGVMPIGIRQRPAGRRPLSLQPEKRETTCGLWQSRPSSKPLAASAIAPDPCRGWGRNPSAHIRAQREPVVPPAGTGTEYHRPEGSPDGSQRHKPARRQETPRHQREHFDQWNRGRGDSRRSDLLVSRTRRGAARRAHRCRRRRVLGNPAGCGRLASPSETAGVATEFGGVRTPCGKLAACAAPHACLSSYRSAACPCSPGSGCMTRRHRSCRCAGASALRTADRAATAAA